MFRTYSSMSFGGSAQRLTASEVWPYPIKSAGCFGDIVLNALRHQRFGHLLDPMVELACSYQCSTPYGIRGLDIGAIGAEEPGIVNLVLNALRHQRFGH